MKKKLTANLALKILAVLFAIAILFIVVNINVPVDKTIFRNIPVEILNANAVTDQGKVYEILDDTDVIDVTIWAKRSILDTLGRDNIIATADMQEINFMDTMVRIKLATNKYNDKLESISSTTENMMISIEDMKREQFVIETVTVGEPEEGYILGNVAAEQNLVSLSGPESIVSLVDRAEVSVNVAGLSEDIRTDASIRLYDADDNLIENENLKKSLDQVKVSIEILQTKRVPLVFATTGEPADGYALTGVIESSPSTVLIAGKGNLIKNISQIEIPETVLNVTGYSGNMTTMLDLRKYLPDGITLADSSFSGNVTATVHIEREASYEVTLELEDVAITGVPVDMEAEFAEEEDTVSLQLTGLADDLDGLEDATITAAADLQNYMDSYSLTELVPGEYEVPLTVTLPDGISQSQEVSLRIIISDENAEEQNDEE